MSELTEKLRIAGKQHKGTDMGALLQWALLHIQSQDEALAEVRESHAEEERERLRLEQAIYTAKISIEGALAAISEPIQPPVEIGKDLAPHINIMAGHGDPDYLNSKGNSIRHVDCRAENTRVEKKKA